MVRYFLSLSTLCSRSAPALINIHVLTAPYICWFLVGGPLISVDGQFSLFLWTSIILYSCRTDRALEAGATEITELSTNAWGDRGSRIRDPFGNIWWIQTHVEDVGDEEIARRMGEKQYRDDMMTSSETLDEALQNVGKYR